MPHPHWMKTMKLFRVKEMDLTSGALFWKVPLFAVPMAITTILQLLYTTIDLWTVNQFGGGPTSMAAIGSNTALINLIVTVFLSLSLGANVVVANAKGAKDPVRAEKALHTALIVAIVGGVFVGGFGAILSPYFLQWMGTPENIIGNATIYLRIYFLGIPLMMIYNYSAQILRALGDSQRPLFILAISGIVNVAFDLLFVIVLKMDVAGVALATIISQGTSAFLAVGWLAINKKGFIRFSFKKLRVDKVALHDILVLGLPAGLQGLAFSIPNVLIQSSLYSITNYTINGVAITQDEIVSGSAASAQLEGYIFSIVDSFSAACVAFVGQNFGAKNEKNIKRVYWYCQIWNAIFSAILATIAIVGSAQLLGIFISESNAINRESALAAGRERLIIMASTYVLDGIMAINGSYLRGMKHSTPPAIIILLGCTGTRILFLLTLFRLDYFHTVFWLYAAYPISWVIVDLVYIPVILHYQKISFATFSRA